MEPQKNTNPSPTTTTPPAPPPGSIATSGGAYTPAGTSYAGGVNPDYKPPTADKFGNANDPYFYTTDDWQILFTKPADDVRVIQQKLMAAYPEFTPKKLGDKFDGPTIKYFRYALNRINQFTSDPTDQYKIRGKSLDKALDVLSANPVVGGSTTLRSYTVTSPTDLKEVFRRAAQETLGRNLGDGDLQRFVESFQQQQAQYQQAVSAGGGRAVATPSAEQFAKAQIEKDFTEEVNTQKMDRLFSVFDAVAGGKQ